jgi:prepilin-type processing-associated H-X9-DG protein
MYGGWCGTGGGPGDFPTMPQIPQPADSIMVFETMGGICDVGLWYVTLGSGYYYDKMSQLHNGSLNWVFCDGHAKSLKLTQTLGPVFMWNPWGNYPICTDGFTGEWASNAQQAQQQVMAMLNTQLYTNL